MATTSLKLPDDLKLLVHEIAAERGVSPHAFMVESIRDAAQLARKRAAFIAEARAAEAEMHATNECFDAADVHAHFRALAAGVEPPPLVARPWRR